MEERILDYTSNKEIPKIVSEMADKYFLLVKHASKTKQLYFKRFPTEPETIITSDPNLFLKTICVRNIGFASF